MNVERLQRHVLAEFESDTAQEIYLDFAGKGFWAKERELIQKYFAGGSSVLDLGCGTGRTTIPLVAMNYSVMGIDISPRMIENAKKLAAEKGLDITYEVGDATELRFGAETWDNALFSNQGWTQIPGEANRTKALEEVHRILKPGGIYIFTVHPRKWNSRWAFFWTWQWLRVHGLKAIGFPIPEEDFGDRFFRREAPGKKHEQAQYIHIPSIEHVRALVRRTGFHLVEYTPGRSETGGGKPVFFVCQKPKT